MIWQDIMVCNCFYFAQSDVCLYFVQSKFYYELIIPNMECRRITISRMWKHWEQKFYLQWVSIFVSLNQNWQQHIYIYMCVCVCVCVCVCMVQGKEKTLVQNTHALMKKLCSNLWRSEKLRNDRIISLFYLYIVYINVLLTFECWW